MNKIILIISLLSFLLFISCTNSTGTVDDTDTQIALNGYVKYTDDTGVKDLIVRIVNTNFTDTTDIAGFYSIDVPYDTIKKYGVELKALTDSLEIIDGQNIVKTLPIEKWESTLPTVYFTQRDISGNLLTTETKFNCIQAILTGYSTKGPHTEIFNLWYDTIGYRYSGFIYFNDESPDTCYSVYIKIFDKDSNFTGQSQTISFTNNAGDILIPNFDPFNAVPKTSIICSTIVSPNDSIILFGSAIDSFEGTISKWEWAINQDSIFNTIAGDSIIKIKAPDTIGSFEYLLKVTDNDNNVSIASKVIKVISDEPDVHLFANKDTVTINDTIILSVTASDGYGSIQKIEINTGDSNTFEIYTDTNCTTTVKDSVGLFVVKVTDDDNMVSFDTISLTVIKDLPTLSLEIDKDTVSVNDQVIVTVSALDKYGSINKMEINTGANGEFVTFSDTACTTSVSDIAGMQNFIVKVTDDDNNSVFDTISIVVIEDKPSLSLEIDKDTVSINDEIVITVTAKDLYGSIASIELNTGSDGSFETYSDTSCTTNVSDIIGVQKFIVKVTDDDNKSVFDTISTIVINDKPSLSLSIDADTVSVYDQVIVTISASDKYGSINKMEINTGMNGEFVTFSDTACTTSVSDIAGIQKFIVKVTDDDNMSVLDTISIVVIEDKPSLSLEINKDTVSINDQIVITVTATDLYGSITNIELNTGIDGSFETYSDTSCTTYVTNFIGIQKFIVKVTDDDSAVNYDTIKVTVIKDEPVIDTILLPNYAITGTTIKVFSYANDKYGKIEKWFWSIDTGNSFVETLEDSSDGNISYCSYSFTLNSDYSDSFPIKAKVIDDDNNEVICTTYLKVFVPVNDSLKKLIPSKDQTFLMGDSVIQSPLQEVTFTYNFYMDSTEVTQKMFDSIMTMTYPGNYTRPNWDDEYKTGDNYPAYRVGWYDAALYCNALSKLIGEDTVYKYSSISGTPGQYCTLSNLSINLELRGVRLPTNAEWEFAARGGTSDLRYWDNLADTTSSLFCWYWNEDYSTLHTNEVGQKLPNSYGLYDMLGNVWEWSTDITGASSYIRGWSFYDKAEQINCVKIHSFSATSGEFNKGFRTVIME